MITNNKRRKSLSLEDTLKVLSFYFSILKHFRWRSVWLIFTGFCLRAITILVFVVALRVFIQIVSPTTRLESIDGFLSQYEIHALASLSTFETLLGGLTALIFIQFIIGKINLSATLSTRKKLLSFALTNPMNNRHKTQTHITLDHIPSGFDGIVKSAEILLFYIVILAFIFFTSPLMGFAVLLVVPVVLALLIIKGRKEIFAIKDYRSARKNYESNYKREDVDQLIEVLNYSFSYRLQGGISGRVFSNLAVVLMMVCFLYFNGDFEPQGFTALILVFSIRYSMQYATELSNILNRVFKQRTIISKIENNPFIDDEISQNN